MTRHSQLTDPRTCRLALFGLPGSGKSTFSSLAKAWAAENDATVHIITLAEPLYRAQAAVYESAGRPMRTAERRQDGALLNFLGSHMRKINPHVLEEHFLAETARIHAVCEGSTRRQVVICSDARPADLRYLRQGGFHPVVITVDEEVASKRKEARGDLTLGDARHSTENGVERIHPSTLVDNSGTLQHFAAAVTALLDSVAR
ncbi:hypothetical protein [Streptomyces sp. NBC_00576]|uniref:hypothetical protein n=1 Tax=Streptomyces sp. NBC_00576 TaxID=2903665 RepID=UPI002E81CD54|nr:hypothetical protein [Streptomyces sp. NBC_00576]WUB74917.1 hypothetical protein OG734_35395 [Streptomyces sp. NBC_00576]